MKYGHVLLASFCHSGVIFARHEPLPSPGCPTVPKSAVSTIGVCMADARMSLYRIIAHTGGQLVLVTQHARPSPECPIASERCFAT